MKKYFIPILLLLFSLTAFGQKKEGKIRVIAAEGDTKKDPVPTELISEYREPLAKLTSGLVAIIPPRTDRSSYFRYDIYGWSEDDDSWIFSQEGQYGQGAADEERVTFTIKSFNKLGDILELKRGEREEGFRQKIPEYVEKVNNEFMNLKINKRMGTEVSGAKNEATHFSINGTDCGLQMKIKEKPDADLGKFRSAQLIFFKKGAKSGKVLYKHLMSYGLVDAQLSYVSLSPTKNHLAILYQIQQRGHEGDNPSEFNTLLLKVDKDCKVKKIVK